MSKDVEIQGAKDTAPRATVNLTVTDHEKDSEMLTIACDIHSWTIHVSQAFGDNPQYKERNAIEVADIRPRNAVLNISLPLADLRHPAAPIEVIAADVLDRLIVGVEVAVMNAEQREMERQRKLKEEADKARREVVTNKTKGQELG